jgi:acetone carboxylase gamma subunit
MLAIYAKCSITTSSCDESKTWNVKAFMSVFEGHEILHDIYAETPHTLYRHIPSSA